LKYPSENSTIIQPFCEGFIRYAARMHGADTFFGHRIYVPKNYGSVSPCKNQAEE
jgi:hypothetical protein